MGRYLLPSFFLIGTIVFGFLYLQDPSERSFDLEAGKGSVSFDKVEQLKKETAIRMQIDQARAVMDKNLEGPELDPGARSKGRFHKTIIHGQPDPRSQDLEEVSLDESLTLDQRMDQFLARKQEYEILEHVQKEAYVEQFIGEARKMGFEVVVGDDMQIKKVQKLKSK